MLDISTLKFDEKGLIPAIVIDAATGKVLTLAYMNEESLKISLEKKLTCFWSRSRQELWLKGETSHKGTDSCFNDIVFESDEDGVFSPEALFEMIKGRKTEKKEGSYTTYLFEKGIDKILKKVGEECTEVIIASKDNDKKETIYEIADLYYHVMVMMVETGIEVDDVLKELASRHVIDKKVKQEKMTS